MRVEDFGRLEGFGRKFSQHQSSACALLPSRRDFLSLMPVCRPGPAPS